MNPTLAPGRMTRKMRVGLYGAGPRALSYLKNVSADKLREIEICGVIEPSEASRRSLFALRPEAAQAHQCSDFNELLEEKPDALIIGVPNSMHAEAAQAAFRRGVPVLLLEKPVAISLQECAELWRTFQECGQPEVLVGFALRYSSFFLALERVMESGQLGDLLTVDADELVSLSTTALFYKGWRRDASVSGGFLVEKCCHDFDLLRALTKSNVKRVFSFYKRTHLTANNAKRHPWLDEAIRAKAGVPESMYDLPTDNPDHQAVVLEWENGITSCFTVALAQSRNTRRIRVSGSMGTVEIDAERETMLTDFITGYTTPPERGSHQIETDKSAHHGGDRFITEAFWQRVFGGENLCRAGLRDGVEAVIIALAAQQAAETGMPVEVSPLREKVFGHEV